MQGSSWLTKRRNEFGYWKKECEVGGATEFKKIKCLWEVERKVDIKQFLKDASMAHGVSGFEFADIAKIVQERMSGLVDEIRTDALGNIIGVRYGGYNGPP